MTYISSIACLILGFIAGRLYTLWTEESYWRPYIMAAYERGREAGRRKGEKI